MIIKHIIILTDLTNQGPPVHVVENLHKNLIWKFSYVYMKI